MVKITTTEAIKRGLVEDPDPPEEQPEKIPETNSPPPLGQRFPSSDKSSSGDKDDPSPRFVAADDSADSATQRPRRGRPSNKQKSQELADRLYEALGHSTTFPDGSPAYTGFCQVIYFLNPMDAMIVSMNSRQVADAWAKVAEQDERVRRVLETMVSGGTWGGVVIAMLPMLLGILGNHGLLPTGIFGGSKSIPQEPEEVIDAG